MVVCKNYPMLFRQRTIQNIGGKAMLNILFQRLLPKLTILRIRQRLLGKGLAKGNGAKV